MEEQAKPASSPNRARLLTIAVVVILALGIAAALYESSTSGSQGAQVSSLNSSISSLNQVVSSQQSEIQSLQSGQATSTTTVTVTSSGGSGGTTTVTNTLTQTQTVTTTTTSVSFSTVVSTTVLPVVEPDGVTVTGSIIIPSGNGSGMLQLTFANTGNDPIVAISVTVPSGNDPTSDLCTAACPIQILYDGAMITTSNPLPAQNNAVGSVATTEGISGDTYTFAIVVSYADGTTPPGPSVPITATT